MSNKEKPTYSIRHRFSFLSKMSCEDTKSYLEKSLRKDLFARAIEDGNVYGDGYYIFRDKVNWINVDDNHDELQIDLFIDRVTPENFKYLFENVINSLEDPYGQI